MRDGPTLSVTRAEGTAVKAEATTEGFELNLKV